ncbi:hypothetical protein PSENEW3_00000499 [Picochlorum sp. SENEW3]|nr:hypothetical protein PSENEW3_00000499 [Picochlorum sp. SENEW3]
MWLLVYTSYMRNIDDEHVSSSPLDQNIPVLMPLYCVEYYILGAFKLCYFFYCMRKLCHSFLLILERLELYASNGFNHSTMVNMYVEHAGGVTPKDDDGIFTTQLLR